MINCTTELQTWRTKYAALNPEGEVGNRRGYCMVALRDILADPDNEIDFFQVDAGLAFIAQSLTRLRRSQLRDIIESMDTAS